MPDWKILVTDGLEENGLAILSAAALVDNRKGISPEELSVEIGGYDALIVRSRTKVTADVFSAGVKLKVVGRAGVGVDNIDLAAANQHGVWVVNTPRATTQAVAEHCLALILELARSIPAADSAMKSGLWLKNDLLGSEVSGKTRGVVGMGNIGSTITNLASAMGAGAYLQTKRPLIHFFPKHNVFMIITFRWGFFKRWSILAKLACIT